MKLKVDQKYTDGDFTEYYPKWNPNEAKKNFIQYPEGFTDSPDALDLAIQQTIKPNDIILTTPLHITHFENANPQQVHTFDISLTQIIQVKTKDLLQGKTRDYWWIDLYCEEMMIEAIEGSNASVLYISNIIDWADNKEEIENFTNILQRSKLKSVMFSSIFGINMPNHFIKLMQSMGWSLHTYQKNGCIYCFIRNAEKISEQGEEIPINKFRILEKLIQKVL